MSVRAEDRRRGTHIETEDADFAPMVLGMGRVRRLVPKFERLWVEAQPEGGYDARNAVVGSELPVEGRDARLVSEKGPFFFLLVVEARDEGRRKPNRKRIRNTLQEKRN